MFQPLTRAEERLVRSLQRRRTRAARRLFLAEGIRVVEDLLASGLHLELALIAPSLTDSARGREVAAQISRLGIGRHLSERRLSELADTVTPQGILVVAQIPEAGLAELVLPIDPRLLVLDGVQDPGNFGTLVRTADALGATAVITLPGTVDPWNPKSIRAAAGAAFRLPIVEADHTTFIDWSRGQGLVLYGTDAGGTDVGAVELADRAALVVGNEGAGLSDELLRALDEIVAIPIERDAESLNVAVATGILLYLMRGGG